MKPILYCMTGSALMVLAAALPAQAHPTDLFRAAPHKTVLHGHSAHDKRFTQKHRKRHHRARGGHSFFKKRYYPRLHCGTHGYRYRPSGNYGSFSFRF